MNRHSDTRLNPDAATPGSLPSPPPYSPPEPFDRSSHNQSLSAPLPSPSVVQTGHSYLTVLSFVPCQASSGQDGSRSAAPSPGRSSSPLPASNQGFDLRRQHGSAPVSSPVQTRSAVSAPAVNPYPAPSTPPSYQVSVIIPSPDLRLSPLQSRCLEDSCPDLECSICFSQFNNVFRCPKMLHCKHTFCLECLARINVKSAQPSAIQCPLCRSLTPLPALGLPRLATDSNVLSCLPAAMQRVYSVRFVRRKGKLQVKRSSEGHRSLSSLRSANRSLDVGLPSPSAAGRGEADGVADGVAGVLFRLTGQPACRAFLLTAVVMMMVLLTGIVVFLLAFKNDDGDLVTIQRSKHLSVVEQSTD